MLSKSRGLSILIYNVINLVSFVNIITHNTINLHKIFTDAYENEILFRENLGTIFLIFHFPTSLRGFTTEYFLMSRAFYEYKLIYYF